MTGGIASRLTSLQGYPGCYTGFVHELAELWFQRLDHSTRRGVQVFACGPVRMLEAVAAFCRQYGLPCQVCLEEFMACAVGGCAGCVVPYRENGRIVAIEAGMRGRPRVRCNQYILTEWDALVLPGWPVCTWRCREPSRVNRHDVLQYLIMPHSQGARCP